MKASKYTVLRRRRAAWRAELRKEKSKYPKKFILATISVLSQQMTAALTEREP